MKRIIAVAVAALLLGAGNAHAQGWQGFVIAGVGSMTGGRPADNPDYDPAACDRIGGGIRTDVQHEPSLQVGFSWR